MEVKRYKNLIDMFCPCHIPKIGFLFIRRNFDLDHIFEEITSCSLTLTLYIISQHWISVLYVQRYCIYFLNYPCWSNQNGRLFCNEDRQTHKPLIPWFVIIRPYWCTEKLWIDRDKTKYPYLHLSYAFTSRLHFNLSSHQLKYLQKISIA